MSKVVLLLFIVFSGSALAGEGHEEVRFTSKKALYEKLHERGFRYVVETKNQVYSSSSHGDHLKEEVIDLQTGEAQMYTLTRLPELDYLEEPLGFTEKYFGQLIARAYNVSDVMVCYFFENSKIKHRRQRCMIFPHPVTEVVRALEG